MTVITVKMDVWICWGCLLQGTRKTSKWNLSVLRLVEALGGDSLEVWGHVSQQNSTWSAWSEESRLLGNATFINWQGKGEISNEIIEPSIEKRRKQTKSKPQLKKLPEGEYLEISIATIKYCSQPGEERVNFTCQLVVCHLGKERAGTWRQELIQRLSLLVCSSWFIQLLSYNTEDHQPRGGTIPCR